jgi:hypothetical protein
MPFLAFSLMFLFAAMALVIDLNRNILAANQLFYAAQSAASLGLELADSPNYDGTTTQTDEQTNMLNGVSTASAMNTAPAGPATGNQGVTSSVNFSDSSINFVTNPDDSSETLLQVKATRTGNDAIVALFLPAVYAFSTQSSSSVNKLSPARICEVVGQPAARVGQGVTPGTTSQGPLNFAKFASLPLAVSVKQFPAITYPLTAGVNTTFTVDLVSSISSGLTGHLKGCLVNVGATGLGSSYYDPAQGDVAIDELEGLLSYFGAQTNQQSVAPAILERNSLLSAFDPADSSFVARQSEVAQALNSMLAQKLQTYYVVPVLSDDPSFNGAANQVVGFAYLSVNSVNTSAGGAPVSLTVTLGPSLVLPNTTASNVPAAVPDSDLGSSVSTPAQFAPRQYDTTNGGVLPRYLGVVLAPAPSPRPLGLKS